MFPIHGFNITTYSIRGISKVWLEDLFNYKQNLVSIRSVTAEISWM